MRFWGKAIEPIPAGAPVVCSGGRVYRAPWGVANAVAPHFPAFAWPHDFGPMVHSQGRNLECEPLPVDAKRLNLKAIAAGPIRDPLRLYLPAGKLSNEEYQHRLALDYARAGVPENERL